MTAATGWLGNRIDDFAHWLANLIRYLPVRVGRLGLTLGFALIGVITFLPVGLRVWQRGGRAHFSAWLRSRARHGAFHRGSVRIADARPVRRARVLRVSLAGGDTRFPLTGAEISAATSVMGPSSLRFQDIRVAQGGVLGPIFKRNGGRAFANVHTVNLPAAGHHERTNVEILLHELVHVYQYERAGSHRYFAEALLAQHQEGYSYGGVEALREARARGKHLKDFNREQQAQIVQDYLCSSVSEGT